MLETLRAWLLAEATQQPVLFIVEDLHWSDPSTLEFLTLLLDQGPIAHLFMLLTCRPECEDDYCSECLDITVTKEYVIIDFETRDEGGGDYDDAGDDWMASLISLRESIMKGDLRSLYLGWLADICEDDELQEPPVPPGFSNLSGSLQTLADFLRIDEHLLQVAAQGDTQTPSSDPSRDEIEAWVANLDSEVV